MLKKHVYDKNSQLKRMKKIGIIKETVSIYSMLMPMIILLFALSIYPICWALRYCLYDWDGINSATFVGLDNFVRLFTRDTAWWRSVTNTLAFTVVKLCIEIPFALVIAFILNSSSIKGKSLFRNIYLLPSTVSIAVLSVGFTALFSPYNGFFNEMLLKIGIIETNFNWLGNSASAFMICVVLSVWQFFGQNSLLLLAGLQGIPSEIYESARVEGASTIQCFRKITVPMIMPVLQMVLMLAIIGSLGSFDIVYVLTNGGPNGATELMALNIYNKFFGTEGINEYGYGCALGVICSAIVGIVTLIYLYTSQKIKNKYE